VTPLLFLVKTLSDLYLLTFVMRLALQIVRADFYNPLSQFIMTVTNPLVVPARRILPSVRNFDLPTLVVLVVLEIAVTYLLLLIIGAIPSIDQLLVIVFWRLVYLTIWAYVVCLFVYVILSWVAQSHYSPIAMLLGQVVEPLLRPVRRILPTTPGIDLSTLLVGVLLITALIAIPLPPALR
jgi:YggT family protein